ncbi:peptide deformylase [Endozoicomonas montiporae]|uniref:Peptide deformylase n=1 Tax=Endozoicomonas montiporae CL-33 TaxID=570277 RepID=A0A142B7V8_9GAMM|nr:peptide deformylase [Endozoicomonas montiporae]AMO54834.1 peptide deformylase [Endozoicomonas montiporae CL-33]
MKKLVQVGTGLLVALLLLAVFDTIVFDTVEQDTEYSLGKKARILFQFNNPDHQKVLNHPTKPVRKLPDKCIDALVESMQKFITINVGGISANQVGEPLQLFLLAAPPAVNSSTPAEVFINPVITHVSDDKVCFWHGCLSAKGQPFGKTATWKEITIQAQDAGGNTFTRDLKGLDAIVAQHEFRHLLGGGYHEHANEFYEEMELMQRIFQKKERFLEACDDDAPFLLSDYQPGERIQDFAKRTGISSSKPEKRP